MLLYILFVLSYNKNRCLPENGTYVITIKIHLDTLTANKVLLLERHSYKNTQRSTIKNYLNKILNDINKDYIQYGIQFVGDYSTLLFEELNSIIDKDEICQQKSIALVANTKLISEFSNLDNKGIGLRIVVLSCLEFPAEQIPFYTQAISSCSRLSTIFSIEPFTLSKELSFLIKKSIDDNNLGQMQLICKNIRKCTTNYPHFGKFVQELSGLEHLIQQF